MKKKLTSRQKQAIKTRNKIYKNAITLMESNGFENITIEDICNKAGVSVGSFYHYFKSKNDIFFEIYKRADEYFEENVVENLNKDNSIDQIILYFKYYATYNMITGLDTVKQLYNSNNKQFIEKGRYLQKLLKDIVENGQKKSEISSSYTSDYIVEFLFISARGLVYDWCLHEGEYNLEDKIIEFVTNILVIFSAKENC
jgi:AcrR family transcriptional regulator